MKALISPNENNLVTQVAQNQFPVAEPLYWIDCPQNVASGWVYINGEFLAPAQKIPSVVSMRQARLALLQSNLLAQVNTAIETGAEADKITWEYATEVNRNDALVKNMATALQLTEQQLDDLFLIASGL